MITNSSHGFVKSKFARLRQGFTLIELVVAIGLAAFFVPALVNVFSFSLGATKQGESYSQAASLAQEYMESVYYLKENDSSWDWDNYPENNSENDYYQPEKSGNTWSLGGKTTSPDPKDGYTATVQILPARRSGYDIDENSEAVDPTSRKIIVNVTWKEKGVPTSINLISYISKH